MSRCKICENDVQSTWDDECRQCRRKREQHEESMHIMHQQIELSKAVVLGLKHFLCVNRFGREDVPEFITLSEDKAKDWVKEGEKKEDTERFYYEIEPLK